MEALFLKVVNMSLSASWLILAVVVLRLALCRAPKWVRVALWAMVAVRLICPLSIESALSLIPSAEPLPQDFIYAAVPQINSGVEVIDRAVNPALGASLAPATGVSANPSQILSFAAAWIWLIGVAAMLLYAAVSYLRLCRRVCVSLPMGENVRICDDIASPFILGIFRPHIYLPSGTDEAQLVHILAHENAHLSRRDHWWKPLGFLVLAVHWFNPLVWLAYILLCRDIELACDEKVIRTLGHDASIAYSEALLACSVSRTAIAACPLAFGEVGVKARVKSVLHYKKPAFWVVVLAVIVCIVVAVCFLTNPRLESRPDTNCWFDYLESPAEMDWNSSLETSLPELPNETFRYTAYQIEVVTATGTTTLLRGMPIWNCYFCDLTGDGLPELCVTSSFGSGMIDERVQVYDYASAQTYTLENRGNYDYVLGTEEGSLRVYRYTYPIEENAAPEAVGTLRIENGALIMEDEVIQNADTCAHTPERFLGSEWRVSEKFDPAVYCYYDVLWNHAMCAECATPYSYATAEETYATHKMKSVYNAEGKLMGKYCESCGYEEPMQTAAVLDIAADLDHDGKADTLTLEGDSMLQTLRIVSSGNEI